MQHQLLFFDIDGTLLSNVTHQIPESALSAIAAAQKNGHLVFINTGRTIRTMPSFLKTLGFDGYLCGCGTRIVYHDEILLAHSFTEEEGQLLIDGTLKPFLKAPKMSTANAALIAREL